MTQSTDSPRPGPSTEDDDELHFSDDEQGSYYDGIYIPPPIKKHEIVPSTTRLIITKITNNFFKSYADETVLGPFKKCFNVIVGPNGSGKSNVIDSMLFVFGYRATRIRCKKLSVLLHNSEKYKNTQSCTVAVHFCQIVDLPGEEYEVVPNSEFVVARTANKDNSSFYELDGQRVQFKVIAKLLRHHGIDLDHNRFLILQGEVEQIAMMKCKGDDKNETGMLEYLEDIIGTTRYKKPLVELTERIENLTSERTEKLNRLLLIEKELAELKGPMEEAVEFLKTENKITSCKNFLFQKKIFQQEGKLKEIKEDQEKVSESRNNIIDKLKELAEQKAEKENALKQQSEKYDHLNQKKEKLSDAFNVANKKDVQLQAEMVQTNTNRKKFMKQFEDEKKKLEQLEGIPEENAKLIEECEKKAAEMAEKKKKLEAEKMELLESIQGETKHLQTEKEKLELELGKLKQVVDETQSAYNMTETELKLARSREETERNKLQNLKETVNKSEEDIKQKTQQVSELKRKIPPTEKSLSNAQKELATVTEKEAQLSNDVRQTKIELQESLSSMNMSKSRGRVLDSLMQQKREGNCPGLYGRLGDLGAIDLTYDVAVSTACGRLDNIVVDSVQTAEWCIGFLKKHGLGRATFIALDKQEHLREVANKRINTPENVPRLFDLIKIQDEAIRTAFYFSLYDTLVANNLDQASRIAYGAKRYRVVTLIGELIETSGTMSGGGRTVMKGRMGQSVAVSNVNPQEVERMENNIEQWSQQTRELNQRQANLENQIRTLQPELNAMKFNFQKISKELQFLQEQLPRVQHELKEQEKVAKATKSDEAQIAKLTAAVQSKKRKFDEASEATSDIQHQVDKLTKEIEAKTIGKMRNVDQQVREANKLIEKNKSEISRLKIAINTSGRNAKKSAERVKTLEQNIKNSENKLREMKAERETIEEDGKKLLKCIEELTVQLQDGEEEFGDLKQEVKDLVAEEKKLLLRQVDVDQTFKAIKAKLNEANSESHQWAAKLAKLNLHDIENDKTELVKYSDEELQSTNEERMELELQAAQDSIKNAKPNLKIISEYKQGQKSYMAKSADLEVVTSKRNDVRNLHDKVKDQKKDEFMTGFNMIRRKLKEMYQMITLGGDADLEIMDSYDPFADGIQLNVRPPKKSWKPISNLSGGEKTLSSLALVFALHHFKPSPLYVMDEIDAALDFKNVSIVGHYIKERTKNAQFIVITLRANMFELGDNLIGIYKIFSCTHSIAIDPKQFENEKLDENNQAMVS